MAVYEVGPNDRLVFAVGFDIHVGQALINEADVAVFVTDVADVFIVRNGRSNPQEDSRNG